MHCGHAGLIFVKVESTTLPCCHNRLKSHCTGKIEFDDLVIE